MNSRTDQQLLRDYTGGRSEAAFAELVRRHVDFVYSAARRMVRDAHLAEDVTQGAFVALAQNARQLTDRPVLSGWLHRTAQNLAANAIRSDVRRRAREQEAAAMNESLSTESDGYWEQIAPHLDNALGELSEADRDALLLRYFERKSAREMAETLGISEEAAQKRVSRAVERLREFFSKHGVTVGASGLGVVIAANAVQAAPAGLAVAISAAAAFVGTAVQTSTTIAATNAIVMTTLQKGIIGVALVAAVGIGTLETRQASRLRAQVQSFREQQSVLTEQNQQLLRQRDDATSRLTALQQETERFRSETAELAKLRGEVARLRADARELAQLKAADPRKEDDPMESAAKALLGKMNLLKQRLEQIPGRNIPEFQYLDADIWARIAQSARLDTEDGVRQAASRLRDIAKQVFAPQIGKALQKYVQTNNGQLPTDISELKPYFESSVEDATLARYQMIKTGNVANLHPNELMVAEKAAVDDEYDNLFQIGLNSRTSQGVGKNAGSSGSGGWSSAPPQTLGVGK